ncbi:MULTISPECIES: response regulator transcription factor [Stenotrophomonas]|uniref:response regulator transcription factor n=1 Tax=Stenotrophomonas TaxID=40323 RepID=UPI000D542C44|nr:MULTISPECIES: response regulator transcription factor [Stenotrophomonas]AWH33193.1 DNA-binding response regulator [Stenotrophomonas sp. SAU14A_NAIMI4_8]
MNGFPAPRRLRLALLDDHDVVRRGTALHLGADFRFQIVASHSASACFARTLQQERVDVGIIDLSLAPGDLSGTALVEHLREHAPRTPLLAFAGQASAAAISHLLAAGINGYVGKSEPLSELADAVVRVSQGLYRIPAACRRLPGQDELSRNEREVMRLLLAGYTVSQIAQHRHRSVKTISTQKVAALRKLGLRNDAEIFAMRRELEAL